jgi:hypothetical protein
MIYDHETEELIASQTVTPFDFFVIEPETGRLKQSFMEVGFAPDDGSWSRGPMYLINRGQLFIGGTVLNASSGEVIHEEELYTPVLPTVTANMMYLATPVKGVVAFDRNTFEIKWMYQSERKLQGNKVHPITSVAILDGIGYTIFSDATLGAFDLRTGQELGFWQPTWFDLARWPVCASPWSTGAIPFVSCSLSAQPGLTVSDDTLFVSFGDGKLYAFGK